MNFEKFLKKNQEVFMYQNYISIERLGEWALETVIKMEKEFGVGNYNWFKYDGGIYDEVKLLFDIAVSCLGKREINKRLREKKK